MLLLPVMLLSAVSELMVQAVSMKLVALSPLSLLVGRSVLSGVLTECGPFPVVR